MVTPEAPIPFEYRKYLGNDPIFQQSVFREIRQIITEQYGWDFPDQDFGRLMYASSLPDQRQYNPIWNLPRTPSVAAAIKIFKDPDEYMRANQVQKAEISQRARATYLVIAGFIRNELIPSYPNLEDYLFAYWHIQGSNYKQDGQPKPSHSETVPTYPEYLRQERASRWVGLDELLPQGYSADPASIMETLESLHSSEPELTTFFRLIRSEALR